MTSPTALEALALRLEACVEDARRPFHNWQNGCEIPPDPRLVSVIYAVEAIATALRARAAQGEQQ
jgi:hypothetical protein